MVESNSLFEWSTEVGLALSHRFCSQVIAEDDNESLVTENLEDTVEVTLELTSENLKLLN